MRRWILGLLAVVLVLAALGALAASGGDYESYRLSRNGYRVLDPAAPSWTASCLSASAGRNGLCVRVRGRVVWVEGNDSDGDGDRHFVVMERFHPRVVKLSGRRRDLKTPGLGSSATAIGVVVRGHRTRREVEAERLE